MPNPPKKSAGLLAGKTGGIKHKWWLVGGVGVGAVAFLYYRSATAVTPTDPATTDPTDPTADQYASDSYGDPYVGYDGGYGTATGGAYGSYGGTIDPTTDPTFAQAAAVSANAAVDSATALGDIAGSFSDMADAAQERPQTNKQWTHAAIVALKNHGYSHAAATSAVAGYLAGVPLTKKQVHTVESAIGHVGAPPQHAPRVHEVPVPKQPKKDAREPVHKKAEKHKEAHHK